MSEGTSATPTGSESVVVKCPYAERFAIEVLVIDNADQPMKDVLLALRNGNQETTARTASTGIVRFEGLEAKTYRLLVPEWDEGACLLVGDRELPAKRKHGDGELPWRAPASPSPAPKSYEVLEAESLPEIAARFGFDPDTVWAFDGNKDLREKRRAMFVRTGESVHLPQRKPREVSVQTGRFYYLRIPVIPWDIRLRFVYEDGKPRANEPFIALAQAGNGDSTELIRGETDGDGFLSATVPLDVDMLEITIGKEERQEVYSLALRAYEPADEPFGLQMRLSALGFYSGVIDGDLGPMTLEAVAAFQEDFSLPITGKGDEATLPKLEAAFGA